MLRFAVVVTAILLLVGAPHGEAPAAGTTVDPASLDTLLAPIALYPDELLAQILLSAANPGKVAALGEWLRSHESVKGTELQDAAVQAGFTDSYAALVLFPQVVHYMADNASWTTQLGKAFVDDRSAVFASIQRLRAKARDAGNLKTTPQQQVETRTTSGGEQVIVIEPTNPQVVYVPQYNPQVVYTQPTTVVVEKDSSADAAAAGIIGFTAGIAIGAAFDNDYYYGPYGYRGGGYMYNDAWNDYYDEREDAREDWMEHREDMAEDIGENRNERTQNAQEQRTERSQNRQETKTQTQGQREQRRTDAQSAAAANPQAASTAKSSLESRGYTGEKATAAKERSGKSSDAFSGYSSGKSERAASQRGQRSRSSSRSGGGSRRR
ncbi:MAG TPA: DUF3300 domain-containing protein [Vicinamibacterales bacterium]|jgi:hypothetical protein|nr:DUF3300 domain-containing protein [Vicinamibacterales bacterium]